jgi:membrane protein DedA with SNARE-associated domain
VDISSLIQQYGYIVILAGSFLEGETVLVLGGLAAHLGYLELPWVILCAFAGSTFGDQLYFFLGRYNGQQLLAKHPKWQSKVERVLELLHRHQNLVILSCRFLYGLRIVTPFALGMSRVGVLRFVGLNLLGAAIWATTIATLGYLFGHALEAILGEIKRYEHVVMLAVVAIGLGLWLRSVWRGRRGRRQEQ